MRKIWVGLDRPPKPRDRLLITAGDILRHACVTHPRESPRIARTQAQGFGNVRLCFFRATDKKLAISDEGVGLSDISVQIQCMFTSRNALGGPPLG
jgi:hypothetical protein